ncbi:MAG: DNA methyltransferase, partial [Methylococcales bacterium]
MNAVEIEEAVSKLAGEPFDQATFPFAFLEAFGNKATTINRLRSGSSNASDLEGGVLQRNNIHIAVCPEGEVTKTLARLKTSPKTTAAKAKFTLATDGITLEAEDLATGETVACACADFANHFGFFLPLAGITTVKQIRNNPIDIQATGRLNRLYVELLKENEEWAKPERRHDLNQFMARLIFCFFAEDTGIFWGEQLFTRTIEQMSESRSGNTHEVIGELFRAMDTKIADRKAANLRPWTEVFPYVNGGLFAETKDVPRFSRIARSYLLHAGGLDWKQINPDIFGSMIQAVADDEERGELGMHYTSVPNILKVLNPLFLDDLREQLEQAGDNPRKLLNLRRRIASIRVFDPACGSGNFLVIAYIQMREIEAEIIRRRREEKKKSWITLSNFYGIELKDFAAEIARLALLIAEFQSDVRLIGQQEALIDVLPLKRTGQIHTGNALRLEWLKVCPPAVKMEHHPTDLFDTEPEQPEIDF